MAEFLILTTATGGSAQVAQNLSDPEHAHGMPQTGGHALTTEAAEGATPHADPALFGVLNGTVWVSIAMIVFLGILVWKKVPALILGGLDRQIADIRRQLDEAKALRAEAEALRNEYTAKIADAEKSAAEMAAHAEHEAEAIVAQAKLDAADLVERRGRMATDKIAAAERAAIAEVRARTATAAAQAAATLIAERHGAAADKPLVDRTIANLGRLN